MTGRQKTALISAIIAVYAIKSIGNMASDHILKEKELEIKRIETVYAVQRNNQDYAEKMALIQLTKKSLETISESRDTTIKQLSREPFDKIVIENNQFVPEQLKERVKTERKRVQIERATIENTYLINAIDLSTPDRVFINLIGDDGNKLNDVEVVSGIISKDDYSMIESALNHEKIRMKVLVERKNDQIVGAILQSIVK